METPYMYAGRVWEMKMENYMNYTDIICMFHIATR